MALNVKILLDPKSYYQKLNELAAKSKQVFSHVGNKKQIKAFFRSENQNPKIIRLENRTKQIK
jgi:hypothetical protein